MYFKFKRLLISVHFITEKSPEPIASYSSDSEEDPPPLVPRKAAPLRRAKRELLPQYKPQTEETLSISSFSPSKSQTSSESRSTPDLAEDNRPSKKRRRDLNILIFSSEDEMQQEDDLVFNCCLYSSTSNLGS